MSSLATVEHGVYDLKRLFTFREALATLDPIAPPTVYLVVPKTAATLQRVGILCGSFNPLTKAHTELAEQVYRTWQLDRVFFTLAKVTVDKERVTGMGLEDRLLLLTLYAEHHACTGVALVNRGLYFEQAQAFRTLLGEHVELFFLVGMDKLPQILDPRYYQDREVALRQLFTRASLIVANRGSLEQADFARILAQPENRPYRADIHFFALPAAVTDLSATAVRRALAAGKDVSGQVPRETAVFLAETHSGGPFPHTGQQDLDVYAVRLALLEALYTVRSWAEAEVDFRSLLNLALTPDERGHALRHSRGGAELIQLVRSCQ